VFIAKLIINGRQTEAAGGATFERRDLLTGAVVTRASACGVAGALVAADAAAAAFPMWSSAAPKMRAEILKNSAAVLHSRADDIVAIACREVGATEEWIRFNISVAQTMLREAAKLCAYLGEEAIENPNGPATDLNYRLLRKPAGVILGIAPWNAPVALAVRAVASPLALGNTVVLKASELCPKTHETVAEVFSEAGLPDGVLNFITNAPVDAHDVVDALIAHPAVRRINFTGSSRVGREIALSAAQHFKRCVLELSGKGTIIVLDDADIEGTAEAVAHATFFNQGQICMSADRIIVDDAIADTFIAAFREKAEQLRSSQMETERSPLGDIISSDAVLRIKGLIDDATRKGAVLVTGGEMFNTALQPTILDRVSFGMRIYEEEVFGPVAGVIRVADAEEALTIANDTEFGLVASVFGADTARAGAIARQIETGIVHVNGSTVYDDPAMPFGGVKASGYGRFGGKAAVHEFTETQWITERAKPVDVLVGQHEGVRAGSRNQGRKTI